MELNIRQINEPAQFPDRIRNEGTVQFGGARRPERGPEARLHAAWNGRFGEQNQDGPHPEIVEYWFTTSGEI
jgi:hypothetical protein